ncbi:transmembrane protein 215 [Ambystoma mexicanum]|uniref:transmembrane protein 215 n=1 Tax=Ambystoma mexicanum TaxID=8296 RepID=UPI0037E7542F
MRPDDINPRTGMVVAVVSVFLVFGFMFTVSGIKGEFLGDIPLLAIGPAICLPGVAAIILAKRTDGCTKWPYNTCACAKKAKADKEVIELLKTPCSDLESGKGSSDELDKKSGPEQPFLPKGGGGGSPRAQTRDTKQEQEEVLQYLEECYCPSTPLPPGADSATSYCVFQKINSTASRILYTAADDRMVFTAHPVPESPVEEGAPEDQYCCYINPQEVSWDRETIV